MIEKKGMDWKKSTRFLKSTEYKMDERNEDVFWIIICNRRYNGSSDNDKKKYKNNRFHYHRDVQKIPMEK